MTTGFVFDPLFLEHDAGPGHVERPERVSAARALLAESGLLDALLPLPARDATVEDLALVHGADLIEQVRRASDSGDAWLDPDTHAGPRTYAAAVRAAGGALAAVDAVLDGTVDNAFALLRPPGHHATARRAMGFCFFNNVAIAAAHAVERRGLERVAVIDPDVHHGNGTEEAFWRDPRVLYASTHQFPYYPGTGLIDEIGADAGAGTTVNLPLPLGCGDVAYGRAYEEVIVPAVRRFNPQLILVSIGFDAHHVDPLAGMAVSGVGYARIAAMLHDLAKEVCGGRIVFAQEGGYDLTAIAWGVRNCVETLLGRAPTPDPLGPASDGTEPDITSVIQRARDVQGL